MSTRIDPVIAEFLHHHGGEDPETAIIRLCDNLLDEAGVDIPVDMRMLASFRGVRDITVVDQEEAGCIYYDGDKLVIRARLSDREPRRRFTIGHEINHTFFPGFREERRSRTDGRVGQFDRSRAEEYLCDVGGAELLFPRAEFLSRLPSDLDMNAVLDLADLFQGTVEATALRTAALSGQASAVVVLEPGWRKAEEAHMRRRPGISAIPGLEPPPIPKKLRVRWAASFNGMPIIPRNKSVADHTPLARIIQTQEVDYLGDTGLLSGDLRVSARHLPYRRGDTLVDRVIALLRHRQ